MIYRVAVTETRRRVIAVEADSQQEAHQRASDAWDNCEFTLDNNDFDGVEFYVKGTTDDVTGLVRIERKDCY